MLPILNPPSSSLPTPSLWVVPVHQPQASSIVHWTWTGISFHTWHFTFCCSFISWVLYPLDLVIVLGFRGEDGMRDWTWGQVSKTENDDSLSCGFQCLLTSWLSFGTRQVLTRYLLKAWRDEAESLILVKWVPTVCPVRLFSYWSFSSNCSVFNERILMLSS